MTTTPANPLLRTPMVKWRARTAKLTNTERQKLIDELDALAIRCARLSGYLTSQLIGGNDPTDDQIHAAAVARSNRTARKVRKALGFTYANDPITF